MSLQFLNQNKHNILVLFTIVIFTGCWDFLTVDQPDIAQAESFFDVPITISLTAEPDSGRGYFGILLPVGWTAKDSISYNGIHNGTFIYSSFASDSMASFNITPAGYYWWMCEGDSVDSLLEGTISLTPRIFTDNQSGTFFVEYMISNNIAPPDGISIISSGKFPVSVNAPMTATVTNTNDNGSGSLRQALSNVSSSGEVLFNLSYPDTIQLNSQLVIDRNVTITGRASGDLSIFGTDSTRVILINENLKKVKISNLKISHGNDGFGGGIYCVGSNLTLNTVSINHSSAIEEGGGIFWGAEPAYQKKINNFRRLEYDTYKYNMYSNKNHYNKNQQVNSDEKELHLNNVKLTNNHARHGGAIFCYLGNCTIVNTTIFNNSAMGHGGGIYASPNTIFVNSILWNNSSDQVSDSTVTGSVNIFFSDIMNGWPGIGNINADPMFVDTANGNYRLQSGSPCIDAGIQDTMIIYKNGQDTLIIPPMAYNGSGPDMGAYEFGPPLGEIKEVIKPEVYTLKQNYPNPFNPKTTIEFSIPKSEFVTLKVYNLLGQEVTELVAKRLTPGNYKHNWYADNLASGVYLYKLQAGKIIEMKKMILLR